MCYACRRKAISQHTTWNKHEIVDWVWNWLKRNTVFVKFWMKFETFSIYSVSKACSDDWFHGRTYHHHHGLSRRARRWARWRSQSSRNDCSTVCYPVSVGAFHSRLLQASFSHEVSVMLNAFRSRFTTSRKRSFGRPVGRGVLGSSLYRTCFGRRVSSIRHTWPAYRRRQCQMMVMRS